MKRLSTYLILLAALLSGCDKWYTTDEKSHVSYLPVFTLEGGEFISVRRDTSETAKFDDPGVVVESNGIPLTAYYYGEVDLNEVGVYLIIYIATNSDGLSATAERIVAVTEYDVSATDMSGTYTGTIWEPQVESKVKKINVNGLYECEDVMGFPGFKMPGRFVDIGNNELILLHGEGYFGRYSASEGAYTRSTLSWTVGLIDAPYEGIDIPVLWRKKN